MVQNGGGFDNNWIHTRTELTAILISHFIKAIYFKGLGQAFDATRTNLNLKYCEPRY